MSDTFSETINETLRRKFESAWIQGRPQLIEQCLPPPDDDRYLPTLEELIHIELEFLWQGGQGDESNLRDSAETIRKPPLVESYLERFPRLNQSTVLMRLLRQEFYVRRHSGEQPSPDEYRRRFPDLKIPDGGLEAITLREGASDTTRYAEPEPGQKIDRYRLRDEQGRGGFGLVWRADDPKLGREVAVKQLSGRFGCDDNLRRRFINEARISARLEHPGIVPVHDMGNVEQGCPYYTMKLVHGETMAEAIQRFHASTMSPSERSVDQLRLLNAFLSVTKAMQYAHAQRVIHRDLKPGNVILGQYGETVILDWGLAKTLEEDLAPIDTVVNRALGDSDSQQTRMGTVQGTPAYMSPEQAAGRTVEIDHRSDIYSLGATLYHLLTGKLPFQGSSGDEILQRVQHETPPPPRTVDASVSPALDAICMKAMARQRKDRYADMADLARDVECCLADEPVSAYHDSPSEWLGRWARRHRSWALAGVATLSLVAVISLTAIFFVAQARDEAVQNQRRSQALADDNLQLAEKERAAHEDAHRQAALAEENFRMAQSAVDRHLTLISEDRRLKAYGLESLRREYLEIARQFYEKLVQQKPGDADVESARGWAYWRLAYISQQMGAQQEAIDLYRRAADIFRRLAEESPNAPQHWGALAQSKSNLGSLYFQIGRHQEAGVQQHEALAIRQRLAQQYSESPIYQQSLAQSHHNVGSLQREMNQCDRAEASLLTAIALYVTLAAAHPDVADFRESLASSCSELAYVYSLTNRHDESESHHQRALSLRQELVDRNEDVPRYRSALADSRFALGNYLMGVGRFDEARSAFDEARTMFESLVARHPDIVFYRTGLAGSHHHLGILYQTLGDVDRAEAELNNALQMYQEQVSRHPLMVEFIRSRDEVRDSLAALYQSVNRFVDAEQLKQLALAGRQQLVDQYGDIPRYRDALARGHHNLGWLYLAWGKYEEGERETEAALEGYLRLVEQHPELPYYTESLALAYRNLSHVYESTGRYDLALEERHKSLEIRRRLAQQYTEVSSYQSELAAALLQLGTLRVTMGESDAGGRDIDQAIETYARLAEQFPSVPSYRSSLAAARSSLAFMYVNTGRNDQAENIYNLAVAEYQQLVESHGQVFEYQSGLATTRNDRGLLLQRIWRVADAEADYRSAIAIWQRAVDEHPDILPYRHGLSQVQHNLGWLFQQNGRREEAAHHYKLALTGYQRLIDTGDEFSHSLAFKSSVAITNNNLGWLYEQKQQWDESEQAYLEALELHEAIYRDHPEVLEFAVNTGRTYGNLGSVSQKRKQWNEALVWYDKSIATSGEVLSREPRHRVALENMRKALMGRVAVLEPLNRIPEVVATFDRAVELQSGLLRLALLGVRGLAVVQLENDATARVRAGDHAKDQAAAEQLAGRADENGFLLYYAARDYSIALSGAVRDAALTPAKRDELIERYGTRSIELLQKAAADEYFHNATNLKYFHRDRFFDPLRQRDDFQRFLQRLSETLSESESDATQTVPQDP